MFYYIRVTVGVSLIVLFAICAAGNAWLAVRYFATRQNQGSMIPIIGGFSGCIGVLFLPWGTNWLVVLPLFLDIGTLPNMIGALILVLRKGHK